MRALAALLVAAAVTASASASTPLTRLTVTTWLEGGRAQHGYTLTCGPAAVRGLPAGALQPLDACRAVGLAGDRLYARALSVHEDGCAYVQAPRGARITGHRRGVRVSTIVQVGACERLLVPLRVLRRFVVWQGAATS